MIDLLLLLILASILNWAVVDIYFYSIVFERVRQYGEQWEQSKNYLWQCFRYMLGCPFCLAHWTAAVILAVLSLFGYLGYSPVPLHPVFVALLIPAVARASLWIRDYSFPPLTNAYVTEKEETAASTSDADLPNVDHQ
jgi:hypothetical protein